MLTSEEVNFLFREPWPEAAASDGMNLHLVIASKRTEPWKVDGIQTRSGSFRKLSELLAKLCQDFREGEMDDNLFSHYQVRHFNRNALKCAHIAPEGLASLATHRAVYSRSSLGGNVYNFDTNTYYALTILQFKLLLWTMIRQKNQ